MADATTRCMSLAPSQWMEVGFDVTYLVVIYGLVALMTARPHSDPLLRRLREGFLLLAIGDTGHVGFRALALLQGGLDAKGSLGRFSFSLIGVGAMATAITVTLLYLLLLDVWRVRFHAARGVTYWSLLALGVVRLALLLPPQNQWGEVTPPLGWSLLRNAPLLVLGLGVAALFISSGRRAADKTFTQLGWLIVLSYAFYLPVILFVHRVPALGVLMVPKTLVYLVMAWLAYTRLFAPPRAGPLTSRAP